MADTIKIPLELVDAAVKKALDDLIAKSDKADKAIKKLGDSGKSTFEEITVSIGKSIGVYDIFAGNLAANLATKGLETLAELAHKAFDIFVVEGVKAAEESEVALRALNVALAQSGNYSKDASEEIVKFAKEIQRTTAYEDDAVIKNAALLESLTSLDSEGLQRATKAAIELSSAFGIDLETATRAVGKAAEGNTTAIKKLGVHFEEAGTKAGTFENALTAIESKLDGNAEGNVKTFAGAISQAKNAFQDIQEEIGGLITQNPVFTAALGKVIEIFENLQTSIEDNKQGLAETIGQNFIYIIDGAGLLVKALDVMVTGVRIAFHTMVIAITESLAALITPFAAFSDDANEILKNVVLTSKESANEIGDAFNNGGTFTEISKALDDIGDSAAEGLGALRAGATAAGAEVVNTTTKVKELTDEQIRAQKALNDYVNELAKKHNSAKEQLTEELELSKAQNEQLEAQQSKFDEEKFSTKSDRELAYYDKQKEILDQSYFDEIDRVQKSTVSEETKAQALLQIEQNYYLQSEKFAADHAKKQRTIQDSEIQARRDTLNSLTGLMRSKNREMFEIGKAASLVQIGINTYEGAIKAYNSLVGIPFVGPALGIAAAAAITAFGAEQAANVSNTNLSFATGGVVPGTSFNGDRISANVNSGEMILNRQQQANLFDLANRGNEPQGDGGISELIRSAFSQPIIVQVDGRELINITRNQLASGRAI
jgi:hypothetical protein